MDHSKAPLLELFDENTAEEDLEGEFMQLEKLGWEEVAERRRKCLDNVPAQVKKQKTDSDHQDSQATLAGEVPAERIPNSSSGSVSEDIVIRTWA